MRHSSLWAPGSFLLNRKADFFYWCLFKRDFLFTALRDKNSNVVHVRDGLIIFLWRHVTNFRNGQTFRCSFTTRSDFNLPCFLPEAIFDLNSVGLGDCMENLSSIITFMWNNYGNSIWKCNFIVFRLPGTGSPTVGSGYCEGRFRPHSPQPPSPIHNPRQGRTV
jgi:hypothetical protein